MAISPHGTSAKWRTWDQVCTLLHYFPQDRFFSCLLFSSSFSGCACANFISFFMWNIVVQCLTRLVPSMVISRHGTLEEWRPCHQVCTLCPLPSPRSVFFWLLLLILLPFFWCILLTPLFFQPIFIIGLLFVSVLQCFTRLVHSMATSLHGRPWKWRTWDIVRTIFSPFFAFHLVCTNFI